MTKDKKKPSRFIAFITDYQKTNTFLAVIFLIVGLISLWSGDEVGGWAMIILGNITMTTVLVCACIEKAESSVKLEVLKNTLSILEYHERIRKGE